MKDCVELVALIEIRTLYCEVNFRDRHATVHLKACLFGMRVILSWFLLLLLLSMLFLRNCTHRGYLKSFPSVGDFCFYDLQQMRGSPFYTS